MFKTTCSIQVISSSILKDLGAATNPSLQRINYVEASAQTKSATTGNQQQAEEGGSTITSSTIAYCPRIIHSRPIIGVSEHDDGNQLPIPNSLSSSLSPSIRGSIHNTQRQEYQSILISSNTKLHCAVQKQRQRSYLTWL